MNAETLNENLYSVVGLDGEERTNVNFATIKEWYFKRQINESSLILSAEFGQWQMLKRVFNLDQFKAEFHHRNEANAYTSQTFSDPSILNTSLAEPLTEIFPATDKGNANYRSYPTENQKNYRTSQPPPATIYYNETVANNRAGSRLAAIFLITNLFIWFTSLFVMAMIPSEAVSETNGAYNFGEMVGKNIFKPLIDLYLAHRLWNATKDDNTGRIWTIVRTYAGSIIFLPYVFMFLSAGFYFAGFTALGAIVFYAFGLLIVLHGKESPAPSRIHAGWISFVLFILFSLLSISSSATIISDSGKNSQARKDLKKYELQSNEFVDSQTPVKITLPNGWKQYSLQNPYVTDPDARMIAMDPIGNRVAQFTVYPYPRKVEISNSEMSKALDESIKFAETKLKAADPSYNAILSSTIYLGDKIAKRIIFERKSLKKDKKTKGHVLFTMDEQNAYVLEMWCNEDSYQDAVKDFAQFETNFSVQ